MNLAIVFVVPGNSSRRHFHLLLQGNEDLKLRIDVTMTASVLIREICIKLVSVTIQKEITKQKTYEEIGLLLIFDVQENF